MSEFSDALGRGLGGRRPVSERPSVVTRMDELERAYGSRKAAREAVGVSQRTWERWRAGTQAPRSTKALAVAQRKARLSPQREARLRAGKPLQRRTEDGRLVDGPGLRITGTITVSDDERTRTIEPSAYLDPEVWDQIVDLYLEGEDDRAADVLMDELTENYFHADEQGSGAAVEINDVRITF